MALVVGYEDEAVPIVRKVVVARSMVYADEATLWDVLHAIYEAKRINHSIAFSDEDACTNQAESYFSRLRRSEIGVHHRIGVHLGQYAAEMAWREDRRRKANGAQHVMCAAAALGHPVSRVRAGYWQRGHGWG